jgi:hypothetical protein
MGRSALSHAQRVKPTHQTPVFRLLGEIAVAVPRTNFAGVSLVRYEALAILSQAVCIGDLQLLHHDPGNDCGVWQERTQEANGT